MSFTPMFIAALVVVPAAVLVASVWFAMAHVEEDLRSFSGIEGMHFET